MESEDDIYKTLGVFRFPSVLLVCLPGLLVRGGSENRIVTMFPFRALC